MENPPQPSKLATVFKSQMLVMLCSSWKFHTLLGPMQNDIATLENNMAFPLKIQHTHTILTRNSTPRYLSKITEDTCPYKMSLLMFTASSSIVARTGILSIKSP